ncbi:hypothetical protein FEE95_01140 [Maribacter algarum]|uniref:DUF7079 domain-containing protein n=1 Tax=Maribacter algarum (ex Zhang et al. 2020) TaxID=2578118 RepID=A0A5S3PSU7_9FLAO|nr:hypothetical protein [Maribacter algarum]TMM58061.1 hypothetical protein FEE95_01140 [Maribacter algarum]
MTPKINIEDHKPIWIALSDLYVDNELQDYDFKRIASVIKKSKYSIREVKQIDRKEIFPVLFWNLLSVAGNWTGFQEEWLVNEIRSKIQKKTLFQSAFNRFMYFCFKGMNKDHWIKLEKKYLELSS